MLIGCKIKMYQPYRPLPSMNLQVCLRKRRIALFGRMHILKLLISSSKEMHATDPCSASRCALWGIYVDACLEIGLSTRQLAHSLFLRSEHFIGLPQSINLRTCEFLITDSVFSIPHGIDCWTFRRCADSAEKGHRIDSVTHGLSQHRGIATLFLLFLFRSK